MFDYKKSVIYQVWPRSFKDSNNDGIGDIQGIISKLDYLKRLGINAIWLSPIYASPNDDYGYDISDYYSINPEYGTMDDFDELLKECKKRDIKLIMDLVANHTSTKHQWFLEALNNPQSKYRDYYIFRNGKNNGAPNNWLSFFGGSAWQKAKEDNMYFLAMFAPTQADLDWTNIEVRKEIYKIMKFYLDKGVSGFRMDVINTIDKNMDFPDVKLNDDPLQFPFEYIVDGTKVETYLKEMHKEVLEPYDCLGLGEGVMVTPDKAMAYTNPNNNELNMTFHFDLAMLGYGELGKYDPRKGYFFTQKNIKEVNRKWQEAMNEKGGYIGNYLSNHDNKRHLDRFGDILLYRYESASALALYNFSLYGTPFVYQGEEFGMTNCKIPYKDWKDYESINSVKAMHDMIHVPMPIAKRIGQFVTRDNARTPVQWSSGVNAGFSANKPWLMINSNYRYINFENDIKSDKSIWKFYQQLIDFRKNSDVLCYGGYKEINKEDNHIVCFKREYKGETLFIIVNLDKLPHKIVLEEDLKGADVLYNRHSRFLEKNMKLDPYEAHIYRIIKAH